MTRDSSRRSAWPSARGAAAKSGSLPRIAVANESLAKRCSAGAGAASGSPAPRRRGSRTTRTIRCRCPARIRGFAARDRHRNLRRLAFIVRAESDPGRSCSRCGAKRSATPGTTVTSYALGGSDKWSRGTVGTAPWSRSCVGILRMGGSAACCSANTAVRGLFGWRSVARRRGAPGDRPRAAAASAPRWASP